MLSPGRYYKQFFFIMALLYQDLCRQALSSMQVDEKTDFSKLKVTQLKQLLKDRGESCPECVEKRDYVKRVRSLYVSDASGEL